MVGIASTPRTVTWMICSLNLYREPYTRLHTRRPGVAVWSTSVIRKASNQKRKLWKNYRQNPNPITLEKYRLCRNSQTDNTKQAQLEYELSLFNDKKVNIK